MKREKRLTSKERKALNPGPKPPAQQQQQQHIHCIACGRHLEPEEFDPPASTAVILTCDHGSNFPSCAGCAEASKKLIAEHDRTGQPVRTANAWH